MIEQRLRSYIDSALSKLGGQDIEYIIEHPAEISHGDYSTNAALAAAKKLGTIPRALAGEIADSITQQNDEDIVSVEVAGPGFINIRLSAEYFTKKVVGIDSTWGRSDLFKEKNVIVEYTDPNPFKEFHIGHLLPNTIGESLSRLVEWGGANVCRSNYQSDVGMHVAKSIWGIEKIHQEMPNENASIFQKAQFLGKAYATGSEAFEIDQLAKEKITKINKQIYDRSDPLINALYDNGKRWSLEYFEYIYQLLGTKFDQYFFESVTAPIGEKVVRENINTVFTESNGAVVFEGEKEGLHTRVFINSEGLPTYEAKELGLALLKQQVFPYDISYVVTANEITDYFKVLLVAMKKVYTNEHFAEKTRHIAHGMMRLTNGKISSRKGNVPTAVALIDEAKQALKTKINKERNFTEEETEELTQRLAVIAIKYSILRQESGKDIIFDFNESLSFEGDSGPYLSYTYARTQSIARKAGDAKENIEEFPIPGELERILVRFPEVVLRAQLNSAPHHIANYLIQLSRAFNSFYGNTTIIGGKHTPYYLALTRSVGTTLRNGFYLLGMPLVDSM